MKLIKIYETLKTENSLDVVPIQCGCFFNIYNEDTKIFSDLYSLRIYEQDVNVLTGFPTSRLEFYEQEFVASGIQYAFVEQVRPDGDLGKIIRIVTRSSKPELIGTSFEAAKNSSKTGRHSEFLVAVLNGYNPLTGELFDEKSVWKSPQIINDIKNYLHSEDKFDNPLIENGSIGVKDVNQVEPVFSNFSWDKKDFFRTENYTSFTPIYNKQLEVQEWLKSGISVNERRDENWKSGRLLNWGFPITEEEINNCEKLYKKGQSLDELETYFQRSKKSLKKCLEDRGYSPKYLKRNYKT